MQNNHLLAVGLLIFSPGLLAAGAPVADKPDGSVERAQFTTAVVDREPVDLITVLENDHDEIQFFTDIRQMSGRTVIHRWEYQGEVMAEIPFEVGGPRWRVYSSKTLLPDQLGKWTVVVVDQSGWPMHAEKFEYRVAMPKLVEPDVAPLGQEMPAEPAVEGGMITEEVPQAPENLAIPGE